MKAMILAAGRGERLRPVTDTIPKPMLEVAGMPLIEHQIGWLAAADIRDVVINLHHLGERIESHLGNGSRWGMAIEYSREPQLLETGGGIVRALPLLGPEPFLVLNGDNWIDLDFRVLTTPLPAGELARLVLTKTPGFRSSGDFDVTGRTVTARGDAYVYCSVGVHHPMLFAGRRAEPFSLRELWFEQLPHGTIGAHVFDGFWSDIGTVEQLEIVRRHVESETR